MRNPFPNRYARGLKPLILLLLLTCCGACAPSSGGGAASSSDNRPEITDEKIRDTIVGSWVERVPEANGKAKPINWTFMPDEPKEFSVLEKKVDGDRATVVVDMKTRSAEWSDTKRELSGKLRLHYELQTDFPLRRWHVVQIENIDMKYKDEPKKPGASPTPTPEEGDES